MNAQGVHDMIVLCEHFFNLLVDILSGISQFLIENFIGSREAETLHAEHTAVCAYKAFECDGKTGCHAENLAACRENTLLIFFALIAEQTLGWYAYNANFYAVFA